ncbi:hypothetical protein B0H34DRAFT_863663 [Crassisporium funariophilum]|nr:hypothetical protein B0H34DRAFT_863663 [Crassisporium funariophilum]
MEPPGADLTISQLLGAFLWKLEQVGPKGRLQALPSKTREDSEIKELTEQMATMNIIISAIRSRYNALLPVNKLPVEALATIFEMVQDYQESFPPLSSDELRGSTSWLSVTRVCHHWRKASLLFPRLWRNINLGPDVQDDGALGSWFVKNSKEALLRISHVLKATTPHNYFDTTHSPLNDYFNSVKRNSNRIQALHFWSAHYIRTEIWEFLKHPLPSLRSLHLDLTSLNFDRGAQPKCLPVILGGETSNLKRLSLRTICSWSPNVFHQLTHLYLRDQEERWRPNIDQFLDSLVSCPLLQVLCLRSAGPLLNIPTNPPSRSIILQFLRRVEIGCVHQPEIEAPCYILQHFNMPEDTIFIISSACLFRSADILKHHFPPPPYMARITTIDFRMTGGDYLSLHQHRLIIDNAIPLEDCFTYLSALDNVREVTLNRPLRIPEKRLARILSRYNLLTVIEITVPSDYIPLVEALKVDGKASVCANLSELVVPYMGTDLSALSPASRLSVQGYQEAGVTIIERGRMRTAYTLTVKPFPTLTLKRQRLLYDRY